MKSKRILFLLFILCFAGPLTAATFTVTNTSDSPINPGTLRWAILQANAMPGQDTINFNIGGGGFWTITPISPLPPLLDPSGVTIDGLTQPGASPGANPPSTAVLLIEISGMFAGAANGFWAQSDNNSIQGLIINQFQGDGIRVEGGLATPSANFNFVYCNFIGTDPSGTLDLGNGTDPTAFRAGVHVCNVPTGMANDNTIDGNLISGNFAEGVWIEGPRQPGDVGMNFILNNYIGTDVTGLFDLGNDHEGVCLSEGTHDNQVMKNLISGNDYDGVGIQGYNNLPYYPAPPIQSSNNIIQDNIIGLDINMNRSNPIPNTMHGVAIGEYGTGQWGCADYNQVVNNIIAFNGGDGVAVWEDMINNFNADHNLISQNSIFSNMGMGIDLGNDNMTPNDPGDMDTGPNEEQNFPVIMNITYVSGVTTISGVMNTPSPELCQIEIFKAEMDPSGYGEGAWYLGTVMPDAAGSWSFSTILLAPADFVSATCTDGQFNTSEFCMNRQVPGAPQLWSQYRTIPQSAGGVINLQLNAGVANANLNYLILGGVSGISPGTPLPGGLVTLPLNWDVLTNLLINTINTPFFANFAGTLDPGGNATAQFNTVTALPPGSAGLVIYFAYFTMVNPFNFVSNHVAVQITPW